MQARELLNELDTVIKVLGPEMRGLVDASLRNIESSDENIRAQSACSFIAHTLSNCNKHELTTYILGILTAYGVKDLKVKDIMKTTRSEAQNESEAKA